MGRSNGTASNNDDHDPHEAQPPLGQRLTIEDVPEIVWRRVYASVQARNLAMEEAIGEPGESLQPREMEVLQRIVLGMKDQEIAEALNPPKGLKLPTIRTYCRSLYRKRRCRKGRGAGSRAAAVTEVLRVTLELWREGVKWPGEKEERAGAQMRPRPPGPRA